MSPGRPPEIVVVRSPAEMDQALEVRRRVFVEEQRVPAELEIDEHDGNPAEVTTALHVLALELGLPLATGRLILSHEADGRPHIGRVAVLKDHRGRGIGRAVMLALHDLARERGFTAVTLAAQVHAIGFYEKLGYAARGPLFLDAGIEHRWMDVRL